MPKCKLTGGTFSYVGEDGRKQIMVGDEVELTDSAYKVFKDRFELVVEKTKPVPKATPKPKKKSPSGN